MSVSQNYPTIAPSMSMDFANTKKLDPRVTFARASAGVAYDGKTVAKAEENLLLRSEEFENAYWAKSNATVTANATTAPDGTTTADKLVGTGANPIVFRGDAAPAGSYQLSVFAKKSELNFLRLTFNGANVAATWFDLDAGTKGTEVGTNFVSSAITDVGNGWYRCSIYATGLSAALVDPIIACTNADNTTTGYTGNGTDGIFIWGAQLEQRDAVTAYTPTTTQPITNYIPVLLEYENNTARRDHNPVTGESLGLLVEEQRTNLVLYSQEFSDVSWTKTNATVTDNIVIAPDGTLTGDLFKASDLVTSVARDIRRNTNTAVSVVNTFSCYAKARNGNFLNMTFRNQAAATNFCAAEFNLSTGVVSVAASNGGNATGASASITSVGNGWYRCSISGIADTSGTQISTLLIGRTSSNSNAVAENTELCFIWGAQLEAGAFATSYIPTVASQVTRSADVASMTGANFSSWYRQDEGSIYVEAIPAVTVYGATRYIFAVGDGGTNNFIGSRYTIAGLLQNIITTNGTSQGAQNTGAHPAGVPFKLSYSYKTNDVAAVVNGGSAVTNTTAVLPVVNTAFLGSVSSAGAIGSQHFKKFAYYPARLTNAQLQALTS